MKGGRVFAWLLFFMIMLSALFCCTLCETPTTLHDDQKEITQQKNGGRGNDNKRKEVMKILEGEMKAKVVGTDANRARHTPKKSAANSVLPKNIAHVSPLISVLLLIILLGSF